MKQSPSEANCRSASQEILRILWNPKIHYRAYRNLPLVRILTQMNSVHIFPLYFPKIHFNIIFLSTPTSSEWSLPFSFSDKEFVRILHLPCVLHAPPILSFLIVLGCGLYDRGFESRRGLAIFLFTPLLGPTTQLPLQWAPGALSLGVKRPVREADNPPQSSAEVRDVWNYTSTPPIRLYSVVLS
jgi:hypothetical protein